MRLLRAAVACALAARAAGLLRPAGLASARARTNLRRAEGPGLESGIDGIDTDNEAAALKRDAETLTLQAEMMFLEAKRDELALARERLEAKVLRDAEAAAAATFLAAELALLKDMMTEVEVKENAEVSAPYDSRQTLDKIVNKMAVDFDSSDQKVSNSSSRPASVGVSAEGLLTADAIISLFPEAPMLKMSPAKAELIREAICGLKSYYCDKLDICDRAIVLRGNCRTSDPAAALALCRTALEKSPFKDDVRLFLVEDPLPLQPDELDARIADAQMRMAAGDDTADNPFALASREPVLIAIAASTRPSTPGAVSVIASRALSGAVTSVSLLAYAVSTGALNPKLFDPLSRGDPAAIDAVLPVAAFITLLGVAHEVAHATMASQRNVSWSAPVQALPSLSTGALGATNYLVDFAPNRKALFDVSLAGPLVGLALSVAALALGASLTASASPEALASMPNIPVGTLRSSALSAVVMCASSPSLAPSILGGAGGDAAQLGAQLAQQLIPLHPLGVAGFVGVTVNALQLLPLGRSDGGRALLGALGRPLAQGALVLATFVAATAGVVAPNDVLLLHLIFVFALQRDLEAPCVEEIVGVGQVRLNVYALSLGIALFALVPAPLTNSPLFQGNAMPLGFPSL
ncbi:hypothetical protein M885DRAFT_521718 [Pelagophyceae sp. CCMP2097]|nr:hypothetical protein M885DRAFT_521718 [Pelagophyceae sp. CCMP2097]|mmetsp:Transcript_17878/g.63552  ORF Transcript_17878/g.63552 Transcript_17878/m.63552 type:complete len:637 (+) Transcript_17878:50-1960(+)